MRSFLNRTMTPSMFISIAALIVAMTGTGVAAYALAKGSVGTPQLKNGAVTAPKLSPDRRSAQPKLLPGQIMTGTWSGGAGDSTTGYFGEGLTFPATLPKTFVKTNYEYIVAGDPFTTNCAGPGKAARGWACFYEAQNSGSELCCIYANLAFDDGIGRTGARLYWSVLGTSSYSDGLWAVRAP
jgi:hypothetical protein